MELLGTVKSNFRQKLADVPLNNNMYNSETSQVRHLVLPFCKGYGCDIAAAGDKIVKDNCDFIGDPNGYAVCGNDKIDIPCYIDMDNPIKSIPVEDGKYDFVYSSHLIEDFLPTGPILEEHIRILKEGGNLILVFPDQSAYEIECNKNKTIPNVHHRIKQMGLKYMLKRLAEVQSASFEVLFASNCEVTYNVIIVVKKLPKKAVRPRLFL